MPCTLTIDRKAGVVYSLYHGEVGEKDVAEQVARMRTHRDFRPSMCEIVDLTNVTMIDVDTDGVHRLATRMSPFAAAAKRVIVAPEDLAFGLARMFQQIGEKQRTNLRVVRTLRQAWEHLALERDEDAPHEMTA
jgi:hypothetical protein